MSSRLTTGRFCRYLICPARTDVRFCLPMMLMPKSSPGKSLLCKEVTFPERRSPSSNYRVSRHCSCPVFVIFCFPYSIPHQEAWDSIFSVFYKYILCHQTETVIHQNEQPFSVNLPHSTVVSHSAAMSSRL